MFGLLNVFHNLSAGDKGSLEKELVGQQLYSSLPPLSELPWIHDGYNCTLSLCSRYFLGKPQFRRFRVCPPASSIPSFSTSTELIQLVTAFGSMRASRSHEDVYVVGLSLCLSTATPIIYL